MGSGGISGRESSGFLSLLRRVELGISTGAQCC